MFCLKEWELYKVGFSWGWYQHETLWHHADCISIVVLSCEHHIFTASKISQNIWKLVLERILQKLMSCTDIQNISSLCFLFSFKGIYSSLEEVCSRMGGKKSESFLWQTGAMPSAQGILIQLVIWPTIRSTSARVKSFWRSRITWEVRQGFRQCCPRWKGMG